MSISTTINMKPWLKAKIYDTAELLGISASEIIEFYILKLVHGSEIETCMFESVKYQERNKTLKWSKLHVSYTEDVYEKGLDLRKILKKSVSKIVAEGIVEFLDEMVKDLCENRKSVDNYLHNYVFAENIYQGIRYFTFFWEFPPLKFLKKFTKYKKYL